MKGSNMKDSNMKGSNMNDSSIKGSNMKGSQNTNNIVESIIENDSFYDNISVFKNLHKGKQNFGDDSIYQIRKVNYDGDIDMIEDKLNVEKVLMDSGLDHSKVLEERQKYIEQQKKQRKQSNDDDEY